MTAPDIFKTIFFAAASVAVLGVGFSLVQSLSEVDKTLDQYAQLSPKLGLILDRIGNPGTGTLTVLQQQATVTSSHLNAVLDDLDREPGHGKPQGTIQNVNKLLHDTGSVVTHIDIAANHYDRQLTKIDAQTDQLFTDLHASMASLDTSIQATKPLIDAGTDTLKSANTAISNPAITDTEKALAGTAQNIDGITGDIKKAVDKAVAPKPWWQKIVPGAEDAAKIWACITQRVCVN